jgi:hypothetical protein
VTALVAVRTPGTYPRWLRGVGWSAVAAGMCVVLGVVTGFAFGACDGVGPEHQLHWVSHLVGTPAGLTTIGALCGVVWLERRALGRAGLVVAIAAGVAGLVGAVGGALVGWAGGVQGISGGGLWDTGHRIGDLGAVGLPAGLALGVVVALRAEVLPRWSGWLPFLAIPPAVATGIVLGALGHDAGTAAVIVMVAPAAQLAVWGHRMLTLDGRAADAAATPVTSPVTGGDPTVRLR